MTAPPLSDEMLETLQRDTFAYFLDQANPANGLVADTTADGAPALPEAVEAAGSWGAVPGLPSPIGFLRCLLVG